MEKTGEVTDRTPDGSQPDKDLEKKSADINKQAADQAQHKLED